MGLNDVQSRFGSDLRLVCAVSYPMADCTWYKNGLKLEGCIAGMYKNLCCLQLTSISHDDQGDYECRCGDESTKAKVDVKGMHTPS